MKAIHQALIIFPVLVAGLTVNYFYPQCAIEDAQCWEIKYVILDMGILALIAFGVWYTLKIISERKKKRRSGKQDDDNKGVIS